MDSDGKQNKTNYLNSEGFSGKILFIGILLSYLVISTVLIVGAIKWIKKPFPGFLLQFLIPLCFLDIFDLPVIRTVVKCCILAGSTNA